MPEKKISAARGCLAAFVGMQLLTSLPVRASSSAPLTAIDRGTQSEWIESRAWGGGGASSSICREARKPARLP